MKKLLTISFVFLYASFNTGMTVYSHFCCETFDQLTVLTPPEDCCGNCSGCGNSSHNLAVNDDYDIKPAVFFSDVRVPSGFQYFLASDRSRSVFYTVAPFVTTELVRVYKQPVYLINRVLLI